MSARTSLRAVRRGKDAGIRVTCEVAPHHFTLTDEALATPVPYDTNTKMNPPLREAADRDAMVQGIVDGSVDAIATDHAPHHYDEKKVEFDRAPFGIVGLETAVPLAFDRLVHAGLIRLSRLIELLSVNPARILRVAGGTLVGGRASRCHDPGAGPEGAHRREPAAIAIEEHAVRRLGAPRRRGGHARRRPHGVRQPGRTVGGVATVRMRGEPLRLASAHRSRSRAASIRRVEGHA